MKVTALKELRYAGRNLTAGDEFEASDRDGNLLIRIGKAKAFVPAKTEPAKGEPAKPDDKDEGAPKKRTYKTRQMKAED